MDLTNKAIDAEAEARFRKWMAKWKTETIRIRPMTEADLQELARDMALAEYGWQRRN